MKDNWYDEPFKFVYNILITDFDILMEIFPEVGNVENIFKFYTYKEAKKRFLEYLDNK